MSEIKLYKPTWPPFYWSGAQKALIPLNGEVRFFFSGIITGLTNYVSVIGDGSTTVGNLPFRETLNIEVTADTNLENLKITGNRCIVKNTHASNYININIGSTATPEYYILGPGEFVNFKYDGSSWIKYDTSRAIMQESSIYLLSTFKNKGLYLYGSGDGKSWIPLHGEALYTDGTALRDPSILYRHGKYWICYTNVTTGAVDHNEFKIISSEDLVTWTHVLTVDCSSVAGPPNVGARVWAPEWYVDNNDTVYIFVSIKPNAAGNHAAYYLTAQNDAMTSFTNPTLVTLNGGPTDWIDAFIFKIGSTYYMWYKDEVTNHIEYATATSAIGPYTTQENGDWAGWGAGLEGPCVIRINDTTIRVYFDKYPTSGLWYSETSDDFVSMSAKTVCSEPGNPPPYLLAHGSVLKINDYNILFNMIGLQISKSNVFKADVELVDEGILITPFNAGVRFVMDGVSYGHFIGTVTGDDTLYIDNRGSDITIFRQYNGGWISAMEIQNSGNVDFKKAITLTKKTISSDSDNEDVAGIDILYVNTSGGNVVLGGLSNGVDGQLLFIIKTNAANNLTIEHNEATGDQEFYTHDGLDLVLTSLGGSTFICDGIHWREVNY